MGRITSTVAEVMPDMLHHTCEETHYKWDICHAKSGSHVGL
jgi:hypothetical protein